jgi:hypothetical protein
VTTSDDATTPAGVPSDNTTLLAVLKTFEHEGFTGDLMVTDDGEVRCAACRHEAPPGDFEVGPCRRMEGASDPDDMLAVLGLVCPGCGAQGTLITHYGPTASPAEATVLLAVEDRCLPEPTD